MNRKERIKSLLVLVGADSGDSTVAIVDGLIDFIPTKYIKHFTEFVLKNYDKYKKPIVNISTASQTYKKRLFLAMIRRGEMRFESVEKVREFLDEFFRGCDVANCVTGLYRDFVTIWMDEKGEFWNAYANKKLNSEEKNEFLHWCYLNQERLGDVRVLPSRYFRDHVSEVKALEATVKQEQKQKELEYKKPIESERVKEMLFRCV